MTTYNTGNPLGSADPRDLFDNAENLDGAVNSTTSDTWVDRLGVTRKTYRGMQVEHEAQIAEHESEFAQDQSYRSSEFAQDQADRDAQFQQFLLDSGLQDLGAYGAGITITAYNQALQEGNYLYRLAAGTPLPYITTGDWQQDKADFVQINFVTSGQLEDEIDARIDGDANLQAQISGGQPLEASAFSPISWHGQVIQNSVIIPDNVNAWSFGPEMTIAEGQSVTIGTGSHWTIANGELQ